MAELRAVGPQEEIPQGLLEDLALTPNEFSSEVARDVLRVWFPRSDFTDLSEGELFSLFSALPTVVWARGQKVTFKDLYLISTYALLNGADMESAAKKVGMTAGKLEWWRAVVGNQIAKLFTKEEILELAGPRLELASDEPTQAEATLLGEKSLDEDPDVVLRKRLSEIILIGYQISRLRGANIASARIVEMLAGDDKDREGDLYKASQVSNNAPERDPGRIVRIVVDGQLIDSRELGLSRGLERDFLEMLPELYERGEFRAKDVLNLGFLSRGTEGARRNAFNYTRNRVFNELEFVMGRPVVEKVGSRTTTVYRFLVGVERHPEDSSPSYPLRAREERKQLQQATEIPKHRPTRKGLSIDKSPNKSLDAQYDINSSSVTPRSDERIDEEQMSSDIDQLREVLRPAVESLITARLTTTRGRRSKYDPTPSGANKTVDILRKHWGITSGGEVRDSMNIEDISLAYNYESAPLSKYSVKAMIREAIKEIGGKHEEHSEAALAFLNWLNEQ